MTRERSLSQQIVNSKGANRPAEGSICQKRGYNLSELLHICAKISNFARKNIKMYLAPAQRIEIW